MRDVTIYKSGETFGMKVWADRENPTPEELKPDGAEFVIYTAMPTDWAEAMKKKTKDATSVILSHLCKKWNP